jgi:hypothetical protein
MMTNGNGSGRAVAALLAMLGLLTGSFTWSLGRIAGDVTRVDGRVESIEAEARSTGRSIEQRLTRIETRLEYLIRTRARN